MKQILITLALIIGSFSFGQNVSITKVIESDCSAPFVKSVELYVSGTVNFGTEVQLNYMQNGSPWLDNQIDISTLGTVTDAFVYIVRDLTLMQAEFPASTFNSNNTIEVSTSTNGNDGYQVVLNGVVVSQFGQTETDADDDTVWEHDDSVVTRRSDIPDNGLWDETHWLYSGKNSLDGETACNGGNGIEAYLDTLGGDYPLAYSGGSGSDIELAPNTTGSFNFVPQAPLNRPPVEVFYHIPDGDISTMPILMSFHGSSRDGDNHRDYWIDMANANGFMVFAPEFSSANYPGLGDNYIMSNIFDDGDNPSTATFNDPSEWTGSILDPLFEYIKAEISGSQIDYSAWGHSAGAQFLHRLLMYLPSSKIKVAICSNAGWYTVPENAVSYPYGTANSELSDAAIVSFLSKQLIVHLGENDTTPSTSNGGPRNNNTLNNQQGFTRFDRGEYFFNTSQNLAQTLTVPFNWEQHNVPNVGHNPQLMANDALQYLLPFLLSTDEKQANSFELYPNPTQTGLVTIATMGQIITNVDVYDSTGKHVVHHMETQDTLDISNLNAGVYFVKITADAQTTVQRLIKY